MSEPAGEQVIVVRRAAGRLEISLPHGLARLERDRAAVAYPDLRLVEHGDWAEPLRQALDVQLPWMPHRTNEELARLFQVESAGNDATGQARVRLRPFALDDQPDTYLLVSFTDGLPITWESHLKGKLTGRLRFSGPVEAGACWRHVALEDAAGKTLARWELLESQEKAAPIPELTAGWEGCVQLDRREGTGLDPEFRQVVELIGRWNWAAAARQIEVARKTHPEHPLLLLLRVWCYEQDRNTGDRAGMLGLLRQVAAGGASGLNRFIAEGKFSWLSPKERYEVLAAQPRRLAAPRTSAVWPDRLPTPACSRRRSSMRTTRWLPARARCRSTPSGCELRSWPG